jgi:hypothetical protein
MSDHLDVAITMRSDLIPRVVPGVAIEQGFTELGRQIGDPALLRVVEVVLSVYLGEGRSRRGSDVYCLSRTIAACGRTEIIRDGNVVPAPFPGLREMPWPCGGKGLRVLGLTRPQLSQLWTHAQHEQGSIAVLDREVLSTLVPLELWRVLAALIVEGPGIVVERLERYLLELAIRPVRASRARRPGATHSGTRSYNLRDDAEAGDGHSERSEPPWSDTPESARMGSATPREGASCSCG